MPARSSSSRNKFSTKEDDYLAQYIAKYNPQREGRTGNKLYQRLVENADGKWPWHKRHTWQSWRERYRTDQAQFDRRIARHLLKASAKSDASRSGPSVSASPAPPPAQTKARARAPESPPPEKRERVPYTMEDDDNLAEYLAANSLSRQGRQGKNLYEAIADEPWGQRHPWQSWHERYKKNQDYFDRRIKRINASEDEDGDEADLPRPRTVDGATRYSLSQARVHAQREKKERERAKEREQEKEKRKRASQGDESVEAPPRKKTRVEQPVVGPSRRKEPEVVEVPDEPDVEVVGVPDGQEDEGPGDNGREEVVAEEDVQDEGSGRGDEGAVEDGEDVEEVEEEDDEEEVEEDQGPIGSDDYHGEIFDEPALEEEAEGQDGLESESDREQEETELMLSDNPFPDAEVVDEALGEDADADVDMAGDETVVEEGGVQLSVPDGGVDENPFDDDVPHDIPMADDDEAEPHLSTTPPSGASPPARAHNSRIEHDIDAQPDTPQPSPAEDASKRHRREHGHEPAPARKHAKRILRKRGGDEDFFGTPSTSAAGTVQNSPTARHLAQRTPRVERGDEQDIESPQKRQREPPRLDEGAWNTAFTDAQGRTRASPKRPRRSGVDFELEDAEAQAASEGDEEGEGAEEDGEAEAAPSQWPPVRGGAKGKGKVKEEVTAPATPGRGPRDKGKAREAAASPGEGRVVTTEHILSVKTIRTVERRPANGFPGANAAVRASQDQPSSPRTLVQEDEVNEEVKDEPAQRHPFNQLELRESRGASSSRGSSIFPPAKDSRKDDIARMQRMLAASRCAAPEEKEKDTDKDKGKDTDERRRASLGLHEDRETFLRRLKNGGGPGRASELGTRPTGTKSPVGTTEDVRRRGQRLARFQEREESLPIPESVPPLQSSPLARRGSNPSVGEIIPHASTSHGAQSAQRINKGKERAAPPPSGVVGSYGYPRRHTSSELEPEPAFNPAPGDQSSIVRRSRHAPRQSLPAIPSFALEEDPYMALGHMFHPPPSGSGLARVYTLPTRPSHSSADPPLYASLPAHERAMVKELGIQCMLAAMARNHGFGLEIVRGVCEKAGSMEKTDRVLREMRESANRQANASFRKMFSESGGEESGEEDEEGVSEDGAEGDEDQDQDQEPEDVEEGEEDTPADDADFMDEDLPDSSAGADEGDSAEVESVLGQDTKSWLDDAPQAESSRIRGGAAEYGEDGMDVDVDVSHVASTSTRKPFRIKVLPKEPVPPAAYSPPKKTRASHFIKKGQKADLAQSPQLGQDSNADPFATAVKPTKPRYEDIPVGSVGKLSKYGAKEWLDVENKYGPGAAKIMMGKALEKLLPPHRR